MRDKRAVVVGTRAVYILVHTYVHVAGKDGLNFSSAGRRKQQPAAGTGRVAIFGHLATLAREDPRLRELRHGGTVTQNCIRWRLAGGAEESSRYRAF